jgi:hypothetical protein
MKRMMMMMMAKDEGDDDKEEIIDEHFVKYHLPVLCFNILTRAKRKNTNVQT